jgi:hypothetical protein
MLGAWKYVGVAVFAAQGLCGCDSGAKESPVNRGKAKSAFLPGADEGSGGEAGSGGETGSGGEAGSGGDGGLGGGGCGGGTGGGGGGRGGGGWGGGGRGGGGPGGGGTGGSGGMGGGGSGGDGGTGGGSPPLPNDGCMGEQVLLTPASLVHIDGTLTGANDDMTTFCADPESDPGNPDVVYELDVAADVSLSIQLSTTAFDPALSLRLTTCTSEVGGDACLDFGSTAEQTYASLAAGTYWLVVDSADGKAGDFTLDFSAWTPVCGDGVLNAGEECDPGCGAPDDGCHDPGTANECSLGEPPVNVAVTQCPGFGPVAVALSADPSSPTITRLGPYNNGSGASVEMNALTPDPDVCGWQAEGPEHVFHVLPQANGTLHARVGYDAQGGVICATGPLCGDFILYVRQDTCAQTDPPDPGQQLACVDWDPGLLEILEMQWPASAGTDYWVFVDGLDSTWGIGPYYLELWLQ